MLRIGRLSFFLISLLGAVLAGLGSAIAQVPFVAFLSGHVCPVALSQDGSRLFIANTPDNTLEIFAVGAGGLTLDRRALPFVGRAHPCGEPAANFEIQS